MGWARLVLASAWRCRAGAQRARALVRGGAAGRAWWPGWRAGCLVVRWFGVFGCVRVRVWGVLVFGSGVIKPAELALLTALGSGGQGGGWRSGGGGGVCWRGERLRLLRLRRAGGFVDPLPHVGSLDYRPPSQFPCHGDCLRRDSLTLFSTTLGSFITCAMVARNITS